MKFKILFVLAAAFLCVSARPAAAKTLQIVATIPELADIAARVGGDHVNIDTLARGTEDIHQVVMRPSLVPKLNRADALIEAGIARAEWPGRLERVSEHPEIVLDGAHNPAGARALAAYIARFYAGRRVRLIFGAMRDKAIAEIAEF